MNSVISQCDLCVHSWDRSRLGSPPKSRCDAFPEGIPDEIQRNKFYHDKPYPGDHGIRYEYFESEEKNMSKPIEGEVTITKQEYLELRISDARLTRLEGGGVDNWEWYGESLNQPDSFDKVEEELRQEIEAM